MCANCLLACKFFCQKSNRDKRALSWISMASHHHQQQQQQPQTPPPISVPQKTPPMNPVYRMIHWGPIGSMSIIGSITLATLSIEINQLYVLLFQFTMCLTMYHMWCAAFIGPGYLSPTPTNKLPVEGGKFCRRCDRTVLRRHHHCPWINNCVGQYNNDYFVRFLLFAAAVTIQSSAHLIIHSCQSEEIVIFEVFNIGLSLGVLIAVSALLYTH